MKKFFFVKIYLLTFCISIFYNNVTIAKNTKIILPNAINFDTLRLLTWNIYMLPTIAKRTEQVKRAPYIADLLAKTNFDVIILNEAFHHKAYRIISEHLKSFFPYQTGQIHKKVGIKTNSGLAIFSRFPFKILGKIQYNNCNTADCYSRKGAVMIELTKNKKDTIQIVNTHLQAFYEEPKIFQDTRQKQYEQIKNELLNKYKKTGVPQIVAGDLNTDYLSHPDWYKQMLETLGATHEKITQGQVYTHECGEKRVPYQTALDYILYIANGREGRVISKIFETTHPNYNFSKSYLSDHYGVQGTIIW